MASQSLYRKWRSQTFGDLVGQEPVIRTLKNALNSGKLAHAYLFTGPRGTGKTSTARLLAKTINCANPIDGEPCNTCQQCREITAGNSFNVIEIDAASNRGIDSIRDLREKIMMPPSTGKYKVYVLDEAHMLTTEAFNALLKTLEEPPDYAIFVMATTDVHKMLPTVLSRCQRFDFKRITTHQIVTHLQFVAEQEHVKLERSAAELIARAAAGGMRDALSLLDQAIAYSGADISLAQVQTMLGVADPRAIQKLITYVAQLESAAVLHLIHELSEAGADLRQLNIQVGEYWRSLMLAKAGADIATILDHTEDETREILQMTPLFQLDELTEFARIFAQNDLMQKNQGTPQLGLELAFLQTIELHRRAQSGQPLGATAIASVQPRPAPVQTQSRPIVSQPAPSSPIIPEVHPSQSPPVRQPSSAMANKESYNSLADMEDISFGDDLEATYNTPAVPSAVVLPVSPVVAHNNENMSSASEDSLLSLSLEQVKDGWERVKKRVRQKNSQTAALLAYCIVVSVQGSAEQPLVVLQATNKIFYERMQQGERITFVEWALQTEFAQKCRVQLISADQPVPNSSGSHSVHTAAPVALQQSAHRERSTLKPMEPTSNAQLNQHATPSVITASNGNNHHSEAAVQEVTSPASMLDVAPLSVPEGDKKELLNSPGDHSVPVAKKSIVRENTNIEPSLTPLEAIKQKASSDPVVKAVMKTFTAEIKDIRPK